jgi:hypothetical protein
VGAGIKLFSPLHWSAEARRIRPEKIEPMDNFRMFRLLILFSFDFTDIARLFLPL